MTSPQALLDTMIFMCGMYFALRSGKEHRDLQVNQSELIKPTDATPYLVYTENISKNNERGIAQRKLDSKVSQYQKIHLVVLFNNTKHTFLTCHQRGNVMHFI